MTQSTSVSENRRLEYYYQVVVVPDFGFTFSSENFSRFKVATPLALLGHLRLILIHANMRIRFLWRVRLRTLAPECPYTRYPSEILVGIDQSRAVVAPVATCETLQL